MDDFLLRIATDQLYAMSRDYPNDSEVFRLITRELFRRLSSGESPAPGVPPGLAGQANPNPPAPVPVVNPAPIVPAPAVPIAPVAAVVPRPIVQAIAAPVPAPVAPAPAAIAAALPAIVAAMNTGAIPRTAAGARHQPGAPAPPAFVRSATERQPTVARSAVAIRRQVRFAPDPQGSSTQSESSSDESGLLATAGIRAADDGRAKLGDHSVYGTMMASDHVVYDCGDGLAQNVWSVLTRSTLAINNPVTWNLAGAADSFFEFSNTVSLPSAQLAPARSSVQSARFDRMTVGGCEPWELVHSLPRVEEIFNIGDVHVYIPNKVTDVRKLEQTLKSMYNMGVATATTLAGLLPDNIERVDNSTLYMHFFLHAMQLDDMIREGLLPLANFPAVVGAFEIRAFNVANIAALVTADMADCAFVVDEGVLTPAMLSVVRHVANGFPGWTSVAGAGVKRHVLTALRTPTIPYRVYSATGGLVIPAVPANADLFRTTALRIARYRCEEDDLVCGFTRAVTIINGRLRTPTAVAGVLPVFETCILERYFCSVPKPRESNWMWPKLGVYPPPLPYIGFADSEIRMLSSTRIGQLNEVGTYIAALLSVGVGTVLHHNNIGGSDLNEHVANASQGGGLSSALISLTRQANPAMYCPPLQRLALGCIQLTTPVIIHPSVLTSPQWCIHVSSWAATANVGEQWGRTYDWAAPYQTTPLAILPVCEQYAPHWGITGPCPTVDVSSGVAYLNSAPGTAQWDDEGCTTAYGDLALSEYQQMLVPHALSAINAIAAHFGFASTIVSHRVMGHDHRMRRRLHGLDIGAGLFQPTWIPVINMIEIGSWRTYDWATRGLIVPYFNALTRPQLQALSVGPIECSLAGLMTSKIAELRPQLAGDRTMAIMPGYEPNPDFGANVAVPVHATLRARGLAQQDDSEN